jgi:D-alanyl-D-alanine carboxypeptidase
MKEIIRSYRTTNKKMLYFVAISLAAVLVFSFFLNTPKATKGGDNFMASLAAPKEEVGAPFNVAGVEAKAVYVFDLLKSKPLFAMNEREQLPLASLTKIMTITLADEFIPRESFETLREKFNAALVSSSNEAAVFLATEAASSSKKDFIEAMNDRARALNLKQTYFLNETGLDISNGISGAYGSAEDVSRLLIYAVKKENTNITAGDVAPLIASKTGFTDLAGGNLAVIFDVALGHPVAAVVLGSSKDGRFTDMEKIIKATKEYLK